MARCTRGGLFYKPGIDNFFIFQIALGYNCNFRCSYCYHKNCNKSKPPKINSNILNKSVKWIDTFLNYQVPVRISFWGGEPLIYFNEMNHYFQRYNGEKFINRVFFEFNTNGSLLPIYINRIDKNTQKKLSIGLSYDFPTLHEKNRRYTNGNSSLQDLEKVLIILNNNNLIKSRIATSAFRKDLSNYLYQVYIEFDEYKKKYPNLVRKLKIMPDINQNGDLNKLKIEFDKINDYLIKNKILNPQFTFYSEHPCSCILCNVGERIIFLDSDGELYLCHGTSYQNNKKNYSIGNILDLEIINLLNILNSNSIIRSSIPEKCKTCQNTYCCFCKLENNKTKLQKYPNIVFDQPCSDEDFAFFKTITEATRPYYVWLNKQQSK